MVPTSSSPAQSRRELRTYQRLRCPLKPYPQSSPLVVRVAVETKISPSSPKSGLNRCSVLKPLIERLHFFFRVRRKQVIDCHVCRRYQDRLSVGKGVEAILPVVISDTGRSHSSVRHGLNEQEDVGLIYCTPSERERLQHTVDCLLVAAEHIAGKRPGHRLDLGH